MDVETAIALVLSATAVSTATEAGRAIWQSLATLGRWATGRGSGSDAEPAAVPESPEERQALVGHIVDQARGDEEFAGQLTRWATEHQESVRLTVDLSRGTVHNTIAPGARIQGQVIQARDIHGNISFGS
ncbi:hypothetical protein [Streptomyces sp. B6B3]|uniref:hypothetical protein n=1 Tax=Streptomyces sp. B6B3 TaxID=3153570 RepID=UPI00325DEA9B